MSPKEGRDWNDYGRVCSNEDCEHDGEVQPWSNFHRDSSQKSGHKSQCKDCIARGVRIGKDVACKYCGDPVYVYGKSGQGTSSAVCDRCLEKVGKFMHKSGVFLCIESPWDEYVGGHFNVTDMREMLMAGLWPEHTVFEYWVGAVPQTRVVVKGEQCGEEQELADKPQELVEDSYAWLPLGDGRFQKQHHPYVMFQGEHSLGIAMASATRRLGLQPTRLLLHPDAELPGLQAAMDAVDLSVIDVDYMPGPECWALDAEEE